MTRQKEVFCLILSFILLINSISTHTVHLPTNVRTKHINHDASNQITRLNTPSTIDGVSQDLCSPFLQYVAITGCLVTDDYIYINSTGIPNEAGTFPDAEDPNSIETQDYEWKIPRNPSLLSSPYTDVPQGPIGVAINGVPYYWWTDANGYNAIEVEGDSFDQCDGHPDQDGRYHYHENPVCIYPSNYTEPPFLGYMFDGFPVYGLNDEIKLDDCGGTGNSSADYRYYMTTSFPYIIGCYSGQPETSNFVTLGGGGSGGPPQPSGTRLPPPSGTMPPPPSGSAPPSHLPPPSGSKPPSAPSGGARLTPPRK